MVYLDNAATTGKKPLSVIKAVNQSLYEYSANAGRGGHKAYKGGRSYFWG